MKTTTQIHRWLVAGLLLGMLCAQPVMSYGAAAEAGPPSRPLLPTATPTAVPVEEEALPAPTPLPLHRFRMSPIPNVRPVSAVAPQ